MSSITTVAVAGATGFVGRHTVRELLAGGFRVSALVRDRAKARRILPASVNLVVGDSLDAAAVDETLAGADACINLIGIVRETRRPGDHQSFEKAHTRTTRSLVDRCRARGVNRFIQMSALGVRDVSISEYQRTKWEAELIVRRSGLDWTIMRPSVIHGPDGEFNKLAKGWVSGHKAPWLFLPYFTRSVEDKRVPLGSVSQVDPAVQPVAVIDVARVFVAALRSPAAIGEVYNVVGAETLTWPELLRHMRDHIHGANHGLQPHGLPGNIAAGAAMVAGRLGLGDMLPFDEGMARMGAEDSTAAMDKLKADLGITPTGFRPAFLEYAAAI